MVPVANPTDCARGQTSRPCTLSETLTPAGPDTVCLCPGVGPTKRFSFMVDYLRTPSLLPGVVKLGVAVNGAIPGPTLVVDENDWVEVTVTSMLPVGTTIHFHGMLQVLTPSNDGIAGYLQCQIPGMQLPSSTPFTYGFRAQLAGTFWWHGHHLSQMVDGLYGALIVRPSAAAPAAAAPVVDEDIVLQVADYYNQVATDLVSGYYLAPSPTGSPLNRSLYVPAAISVNGVLNKGVVYGDGSVSPGLTFAVPRARVRFRVINAAAFSSYFAAIEGLNFNITELDSTAVHPFPARSVFVSNGQRVSFVIDLSRIPASVPALVLLVGTDEYSDEGNAVPAYESGSPAAKPFNPVYRVTLQFQPLSAGIVEPPPLSLDAFELPAPPATQTSVLAAVPVYTLPRGVPSPTKGLSLAVEQALVDNVTVARVNGVYAPAGFLMGLSPPVLYSFMRNDVFNQPYVPGIDALLPSPISQLGSLPYFNASKANDFNMPGGDAVLILFNTSNKHGHAWHFHGHNVYVIASSAFPTPVSSGNYLRRDTVAVPDFGWLLVLMVLDNPGIWPLHCHMEWHVQAGLGVWLYEAVDLLAGMNPPASQWATCGFPPQLLATATPLPTPCPRQRAYPTASSQQENVFPGALAGGIVGTFTLGVVFAIFAHSVGVKKGLAMAAAASIKRDATEVAGA